MRQRAFAQKRCSNCGTAGHKATYNGKWLCPKPKSATFGSHKPAATRTEPSLSWNTFARKEIPSCTPLSSSAESPSSPSSSETIPQNAPPPIDLSASAPSQPSPSQGTTETATNPTQGTTSPPPSQPQSQQSHQASPHPSTSPQARNVDAEAFGELAGQFWISGLAMGNAYVEKHGGFVLAKEVLKMNEIAMAHLATKYAKETGAKPEDMAAGTVVVSGALVGGQSAWYAYQDYTKNRKPKVQDVDPRAVNPTTGKPTAGGPVTPTNGQPVARGPIQGPGAIQIVPRGFDPGQIG